jgi:hypothetical protein
MGRWLTLRNANRAAWTLLALLALAPAVFAATLLIKRITSGRTDAAETGSSARAASAAAPSTPPTSAPTVRTNGTLEQVQGQALVLREPNGDLQRVLLRSDATVTRETIGNGADKLREGDAVYISRFVEQQDNTLSIMEVTLTAPPTTVPPEQCGRYGTVVAVAPNRLTYESPCGRRELPMRRSVAVRRVESVDVSALKAGQRASLFGQRLPDGTLSAFQIQVTEMQ